MSDNSNQSQTLAVDAPQTAGDQPSGTGFASSLVSLDDLKDFHTFSLRFQNSFSTLDRDGDFVITQDELTAGKTNPDLSSEAREMAGELQKHFYDIRDMAYTNYDSPANGYSDNFRNSLFGSDEDVNGLTRRDLQVMLSLNDPQKFEDGVKNLRSYELTMASLGIGGGASSAIFGTAGVIAAGGNPLNALTVWSVPAFAGLAATGTVAFVFGMDALLHPGEDGIKEQVVARMQKVANWNA